MVGSPNKATSPERRMAAMMGKTINDSPPERLFIKNNVDADNSNGSAYISGTKTRQLRKNKNSHLNCAIGSNSLKDQKERCSSMSKLLDENHPPNTEFYDLSRTKSFRVDGQEVTPRIFRASDLVQGT